MDDAAWLKLSNIMISIAATTQECKACELAQEGTA